MKTEHTPDKITQDLIDALIDMINAFCVHGKWINYDKDVVELKAIKAIEKATGKTWEELNG